MSESRAESSDRRRHAPAAERNRDFILEQLQTHLPPQGTVLEIASGTGQHGAYFARALDPRHWLPSDPSPEARASIAAWREAAPCDRLHPPLDLDMTMPRWPSDVRQWWQQRTDQGQPVPPMTAVVAINLIHISPWAACEGLVAGAATLLPPEGVLYLYGPYRRQGRHTAPSNAAFDASLRSRDARWGVRDLEAVVDLARGHGFAPPRVIPMPANNFSVVFNR